MCAQGSFAAADASREGFRTPHIRAPQILICLRIRFLVLFLFPLVRLLARAGRATARLKFARLKYSFASAYIFFFFFIFFSSFSLLFLFLFLTYSFASAYFFFLFSFFSPQSHLDGFPHEPLCRASEAHNGGGEGWDWGGGGWGGKTWADDKAGHSDELEIERDLARYRMCSLEREVARRIDPQKLFVGPPAKAW
jgi:hypothetical protein